MQIIICTLVGIIIGIILTSLMSASKISDLVYERDEYRRKLVNEKIKTEQRDILIKDIIKESVTTGNQTTNS